MSLIKLDYDGKTLWTFKHRRWVLNYLGLNVEWIEKDRTVHGGFHIRIKVKKKLKPAVICCIQVLMGSDYRRGTYDLFRIMKGIKRWSALFRGTERAAYPELEGR